MPETLLDADTAWELILDAIGRSEPQIRLPGSNVVAVHSSAGQPVYAVPVTDEAKLLIECFLPLCRSPGPDSSLVVGQMGQSLDGRIATVTGASQVINGDDGLTHLHRLRAVSDAVIVGAGTAASDNPRLTVRHTTGVNPVRVVIDRQRRVPDDAHVFTDYQAPTLRLTAGDYHPGDQGPLPDRYGYTEVPCLGSEDKPVDPAVILAVLRDFGLKRIFVEGGGQTVSGFLDAGLLDRLHVIVAPMIIGSGRAAFDLPEISALDQAMRPRARFVNLGSDMLFDLDFSAETGPAPQ